MGKSEKDMKILAVDVGYSFVKVVDEKDRKFSFPSSCERYISDGTAHANDADVVTLGGVEYKVGFDLGDTRRANNDFHGTDPWKALLCYAMHRCLPGEGSNIRLDHLALGLPYSQYNERVIGRISQSKKYVFEVNGETKVVEIGKLHILPQGGAMLFGNGDLDLSNMGLIDVGYYTVDCVMMHAGKFVRDRSQSFPLGVEKAFKQIHALLVDRLGVSSVDFSQLLGIVQAGGKFPFDGEEMDLSQEIAGILSGYWDRVVGVTEDLWQDYVRFFSETVVAGGGAELLRPYINDKKMRIVDDAIFGNARGYMAKIRFSLKGTAKDAA